MKKLLTLLAFSIVFISCKKDEENVPLTDDPDTIQNPTTPGTSGNTGTNPDTTGNQNCITLLSPSTTDIVSPYYPEFSWQSCDTTSYRFTLSLSPDFSSSVLDTVLSVTNFQFQDILKQDTTYYLEISQSSGFVSSQFRTGNYASAIVGTHPVNIRHYYMTPPDSIWFDSTYTGNLEIRILPNNNLLVSESVTGHSYEVYYFVQYPNKDKITWRGYSDGYNRDIKLVYDLNSKVLEFSFRLGGLMYSGHFWIMKTTINL